MKPTTFRSALWIAPLIGLVASLPLRAQAIPGLPDNSPLTLSKIPIGTPEGLKPIARFALVEGKLWAAVYSHTLDTVAGPLPCWTYATVGMQSAGQKEMLLTIKREEDEPETAFDRFLPNLFTAFYQFAQKGQRVDVGSYTQLGRGGTPLLGRSDFIGLIYTAPQPLKGIEVKADYLAGQ